MEVHARLHARTAITFTVTTSVEGSHTVEVNGLEGSFTVTAPPPPSSSPKAFPWIWVGVALIVVLAGVAYLYYMQRRSEDESFISFWRPDQSSN